MQYTKIYGSNTVPSFGTFLYASISFYDVSSYQWLKFTILLFSMLQETESVERFTLLTKQYQLFTKNRMGTEVDYVYIPSMFIKLLICTVFLYRLSAVPFLAGYQVYAGTNVLLSSENLLYNKYLYDTAINTLTRYS